MATMMVCDEGGQAIVETLEPAFFEQESATAGNASHGGAGEIQSRLTADTSVLQSLFGSSLSVALRNLLMLIGAVIMMEMAKLAAPHLDHVEIIELHHDRKADAPSGTAIKTANLLAEARTETPALLDEKELIPGARGGKTQGIPVHSIRLPGLVAHQEVIFGGKSETLTIRHDSIHRESFMPGVCLACKKAVALNELVYGLEHVL